MKNKHKKAFKLIVIIILILILISYAFFSNTTEAEESSTVVETTDLTAEVTERTITTTLTAPGEVQSATMEKLTLNTSYYYLSMCAEEDEFVAEGDNLLKYTNGTYLVAPYDCVIMGYSVPTVNEICTSSNYVYIASTADLYMDINIGEDQIGVINVGQEVEIIANYDESKTYTGTISKMNAVGTHSSSGTTFAAVASIANVNNELKIGMSATCTITIEKNEDVLTLPIEAIQIDDDERYVYLVNDDGSTEKTIVETGKSDANYVQITSGLSLGDVVSYEMTTVTVTSSDDEDESNSTSLFDSLLGGGSNSSGKSDRDRGGF